MRVRKNRKYIILLFLKRSVRHIRACYIIFYTCFMSRMFPTTNKKEAMMCWPLCLPTSERQPSLYKGSLLRTGVAEPKTYSHCSPGSFAAVYTYSSVWLAYANFIDQTPPPCLSVCLSLSVSHMQVETLFQDVVPKKHWLPLFRSQPVAELCIVSDLIHIAHFSISRPWKRNIARGPRWSWYYIEQ